MNNRVKNMNKINIELFEAPYFRLDCIRCVSDLRAVWNGLILTGNFWRLYHNDKPGAGIFLHGRKLEMLPDSIYLLPPNCDLKVWCGEDNINQLYIHFEVSRISGNPGMPLNKLKLSGQDQLRIMKLRQELQAEKESPQNDLLAIALAADCLTRLPGEAMQELGSDERISKICAEIRENPAREFSLAALAENCGMAPNSFLRLFRDITGTTPYQYILNMRYSLAARLLRTTPATLEEVCDMIGVKDRFHFSRRFKSYYGISPAAYRKQKTVV